MTIVQGADVITRPLIANFLSSQGTHIHIIFYYYYFHPCILKAGRANTAIIPYHIVNKRVLLSQNSQNFEYFVNYALRCFFGF